MPEHEYRHTENGEADREGHVKGSRRLRFGNRIRRLFGRSEKVLPGPGPLIQPLTRAPSVLSRPNVSDESTNAIPKKRTKKKKRKKGGAARLADSPAVASPSLPVGRPVHRKKRMVVTKKRRVPAKQPIRQGGRAAPVANMPKAAVDGKRRKRKMKRRNE